MMPNEKCATELTQFDVNNLENIFKRWSRWSKRLDRLLDIKGVREDSTKINYLFYYGGDCLEDVYSDLAHTDDKFEDITRKLYLFFRRCGNQQSFSDKESFEELPSKKDLKKEDEMITLELVIDEENEKVTDLIQKYNQNREKLRELENEKIELNQLIKTTIGLKINEVTSKSTTKIEKTEDSEAQHVRKEECLEMLCNKRRASSAHRVNRHSDYMRKIELQNPRHKDDYFCNLQYTSTPKQLFNQVKRHYPLMYRDDCHRYKFERLHFKKKIID